MNIIKIILFWVCIAFLLNACKDSLGYDPNVQVTPIVKDTIKPPDGNTDTAKTKIKIDSLRITLKEFYKSNGKDFFFYWDGKILNKDIVIDTSSKSNFLWFSLSMETTDSEKDFRSRYRWDWVHSFEINFATVAEQHSINLDGDKSSSKWFTMTLKKLDHMDVKSYSDLELKSSVNIIDHDYDNKVIRLSFNSALATSAPFFTKQFTGYVVLYYK